MSIKLQGWIKIYHQVKELGKELQDSRPSYTKSKRLIPAVKPLSQEMQKELEEHIFVLQNKCKKYLDRRGKRMPVALWVYDEKDNTTHASSVNFAHKDKMSEMDILRYGREFMSVETKELNKKDCNVA